MIAHDKTRLTGKVAIWILRRLERVGFFVFIKPLGYRAALLVKTNFILIENKL